MFQIKNHKIFLSFFFVVFFTFYFLFPILGENKLSLLFTLSALAAVGEAPSQEYKLKPQKDESGEILGQANTKEEYIKQGYVMRSGFSYISSTLPFALQIDNLVVDFGILASGVPTSQQNELSISTGSVGGWQVSIFQNHPLQLAQNQTEIPSVTCDNGDCTPAAAALWTKTDIYGLGFSVSGDATAPDFTGEDYYRPFADAAKAQSPAVIMSQNPAGVNPPSSTKSITITYKVNIPQSIQIGKYSNNITFVAIPRY
jgi:hypothetical protein